MNPKIEFIFNRRSIRIYNGQAIPDELVKDLLEAAMAAPSAVRKDPWRFLVIRNKDTFQKIVEFLPNGKMLLEADLCILICGDIEKAHDRQESYMIQDLSAATENILLAAHALGLGACWLGIHPRKDRIQGIKNLFNLPENIIPVTGISLGWPAENPKPRTRFNPDFVHSEKW